jgi:hypothetical protein
VRMDSNSDFYLNNLNSCLNAVFAIAKFVLNLEIAAAKRGVVLPTRFVWSLGEH